MFTWHTFSLSITLYISLEIKTEKQYEYVFAKSTQLDNYQKNTYEERRSYLFPWNV